MTLKLTQHWLTAALVATLALALLPAQGRCEDRSILQMLLNLGRPVPPKPDCCPICAACPFGVCLGASTMPCCPICGLTCDKPGRIEQDCCERRGAPAAASTPCEGCKGSLEVMSSGECAVRRTLAARKASLSFDHLPIRCCLNVVAALLGDLHLLTDDEALGTAGVCLDQPIDMCVEDMSLECCLAALLKPLHLTYVIEDQSVIVTTQNGCGQCRDCCNPPTVREECTRGIGQACTPIVIGPEARQRLLIVVGPAEREITLFLDNGSHLIPMMIPLGQVMIPVGQQATCRQAKATTFGFALPAFGGYPGTLATAACGQTCVGAYVPTTGTIKPANCCPDAGCCATLTLQAGQVGSVFADQLQTIKELQATMKEMCVELQALRLEMQALRAGQGGGSQVWNYSK